MTGRRPKVLPSGTHLTHRQIYTLIWYRIRTYHIFDAPSMRLLTAMRWVSELYGTRPVGGPCPRCAKAVTRSGNALLITELDTLAVKA